MLHMVRNKRSFGKIPKLLFINMTSYNFKAGHTNCYIEGTLLFANCNFCFCILKRQTVHVQMVFLTAVVSIILHARMMAKELTDAYVWQATVSKMEKPPVQQVSCPIKSVNFDLTIFLYPFHCLSARRDLHRKRKQ